jgi:hypothetical protein
MYAIDDVMMLVRIEVMNSVYAHDVNISADGINGRIYRPVKWVYRIELRDEARIPQAKIGRAVALDYQAAQVASIILSVRQVLVQSDQ